MKPLPDIPVHQLPELEFLAAASSTAFGEHMQSHRINFYAIIWFTEDEGVHFIDFEPFPIQKNKVYLLGRNQVHSIPADSLPEARIIVFSTVFFQRIEEAHLRQLFLPFLNDGVSIPPAMVTPMKQLFKLILLEYQGDADATMLLKYTAAFLMQLYRFGDYKNLFTPATEDKRIVKLFHLLQEHYKENREASFYADQIGLTAKRINEILRERMGTTISQLLYHLLLIEAKRELFHHERSIKEIAYELGFSEQSYFARFFKKHTGFTPEQFRAQPHTTAELHRA